MFNDESIGQRRVVDRVICPHHNSGGERTPSLVIYEDHCYCYSCGYRQHSFSSTSIRDPRPIYREDIQRSIQRICSLLSTQRRQIPLHADEHSEYIVWPDQSYYKRRFINPRPGQPKYVSPVGHTKPLFVLPGGLSLIITEGEINALSIKLALPDATVVCPGSATDFYASKYDCYLQHYLAYETILLIADDDKAGITALINLKAKLLALDPTREITTWACSEDANDILVKHGKEKLKEEIERRMGMPSRVPQHEDGVRTLGSAAE